MKKPYWTSVQLTVLTFSSIVKSVLFIYVDEFVCLGSRGSTSGGGGLGLEGNLVI